MKLAAFITNPLSQRVARRGSVLANVTAPFVAARYIIEDFSALEPYVAGLITCEQNAPPDTIVIEGGDGTVQAVMTAMLKTGKPAHALPQIILLPGGMTNLVAGQIGVKRPTAAKLDGILSGRIKAAVYRQSLLRLETDIETHHGFLFTTGAFPKATQYCLDEIHTRGIGGAGAVRATLLKVLLGGGAARDEILAPTALKAELDSLRFDDPHIMSLATTLPKLMIGLKPYWGSGDGEVHFTMLLPPLRRKVRNVTRMFKPEQTPSAIEKLKQDGFESWKTHSARLHYDGPMVLDGEFIRPGNSGVILSAAPPLEFVRA